MTRDRLSDKKVYYFNTIITLAYTYDYTSWLTRLFRKSSNRVSSATIYWYNDKGLVMCDTTHGRVQYPKHHKKDK